MKGPPPRPARRAARRMRSGAPQRGRPAAIAEDWARGGLLPLGRSAVPHSPAAAGPAPCGSAAGPLRAGGPSGPAPPAFPLPAAASPDAFSLPAAAGGSGLRRGLLVHCGSLLWHALGMDWPQGLRDPGIGGVCRVLRAPGAGGGYCEVKGVNGEYMPTVRLPAHLRPRPFDCLVLSSDPAEAAAADRCAEAAREGERLDAGGVRRVLRRAERQGPLGPLLADACLLALEECGDTAAQLRLLRRHWPPRRAVGFAAAAAACERGGEWGLLQAVFAAQRRSGLKLPTTAHGPLLSGCERRGMRGAVYGLVAGLRAAQGGGAADEVTYAAILGAAVALRAPRRTV
eukprot:TRINITY_DN21127_c0_g1_i1.p1 TRINITY_DN21127_c0_g1~~TRINITY_DN21127_c0_g1_i1.p1  ORF type:complete len:367 (+),score=118.69 TRINITY_DN21127_c0_g1_i1:73-1101(+)